MGHSTPAFNNVKRGDSNDVSSHKTGRTVRGNGRKARICEVAKPVLGLRFDFPNTAKLHAWQPRIKMPPDRHFESENFCPTKLEALDHKSPRQLTRPLLRSANTNICRQLQAPDARLPTLKSKICFSRHSWEPFRASKRSSDYRC